MRGVSACCLLTTITFLGEGPDLTGPYAAQLVFGRRPKANALSASRRTTKRSSQTHKVPRMPSMACEQHFDARTQARRASDRDPLVPLLGVLSRPFS
jgi:hypothetical protein